MTTNATKRTCAADGCRTILRTTNPTDYCGVHIDPRVEAVEQEKRAPAEPGEYGPGENPASRENLLIGSATGQLRRDAKRLLAREPMSARALSRALGVEPRRVNHMLYRMQCREEVTVVGRVREDLGHRWTTVRLYGQPQRDGAA